MKRTDRLRAAVEGKPLDRVPVSAWGHFFDRETTAEGLAEAMLDFQRAYDWDFIKIHARASYPAEGFGFSYRPSGTPGKMHESAGHPIRSAADWKRLRPLSLTDAALREQLRAIEIIRRRAAPDLALIMTVFSPLDVADKLVGRETGVLRRYIDEDPDAVRHGVALFAETTSLFVRALARSGIDGIYFATKWANAARLEADRHREIARPFDLQVLAEARPMWCNFLHLCEDDIHFQAMADYPVQVIHWDNHSPRNPSVAQGRSMCGKALGGGVDPSTLAQGTAADVARKARAALAQADGRHFILGPGCSVDIARTPADNLLALRNAAEPGP